MNENYETENQSKPSIQTKQDAQRVQEQLLEKKWFEKEQADELKLFKQNNQKKLALILQVRLLKKIY